MLKKKSAGNTSNFPNTLNINQLNHARRFLSPSVTLFTPRFTALPLNLYTPASSKVVNFEYDEENNL